MASEHQVSVEFVNSLLEYQQVLVLPTLHRPQPLRLRRLFLPHVMLRYPCLLDLPRRH